MFTKPMVNVNLQSLRISLINLITRTLFLVSFSSDISILYTTMKMSKLPLELIKLLKVSLEWSHLVIEVRMILSSQLFNKWLHLLLLNPNLSSNLLQNKKKRSLSSLKTPHLQKLKQQKLQVSAQMPPILLPKNSLKSPSQRMARLAQSKASCKPLVLHLKKPLIKLQRKQ